MADLPAPGANAGLKIHVAYGFHVNCYHSYRGDTNDAQGPSLISSKNSAKQNNAADERCAAPG